MQSLRTRIDKLTNRDSTLPRVITYQVGDPPRPEVDHDHLGVLVYLPDNNRNGPYELERVQIENTNVDE